MLYGIPEMSGIFGACANEATEEGACIDIIFSETRHTFYFLILLYNMIITMVIVNVVTPATLDPIAMARMFVSSVVESNSWEVSSNLPTLYNKETTIFP